MSSLKDDRGYNQVFIPSYATNKRLERRADLIAAQFTDENEKKILEIGSGLGTMANMIAHKTRSSILGIDLCQPFVDQANARYKKENLSFEVMDFNTPSDFNNQRFDYVIGNGILHHLYYNLDAALVNIRKLLKPGGKFIFWEPNIYNPFCYVIFTYPYFRKKASLEPAEMAFSKPFISEKLAAAGYQNIRVEYRDFLLPGISIMIGSIIEKIPVLRKTAQSIFITAENPRT
jgi:2-polyprenyl-3-methyl-5-hydroxy-6-metoxy-1,4-benzoquinol methylase